MSGPSWVEYLEAWVGEAAADVLRRRYAALRRGEILQAPRFDARRLAGQGPDYSDAPTAREAAARELRARGWTWGPGSRWHAPTQAVPLLPDADLNRQLHNATAKYDELPAWVSALTGGPGAREVGRG